MRKKILISAAGTATAFHLSELIRTKLDRHFVLFLCDINPQHLVASAGFAERFFTVPLVSNDRFRPSMLDIFKQEGIQIYVPLIDTDVYSFPADDVELCQLGVQSAAPPKSSAAILNNKRTLSDFLRSRDLPAPRTFSFEEVANSDLTAKYFVKPEHGWGSTGARVATGREIKELTGTTGKLLIQDLCTGPELTVEVYNFKGTVRALCRERIETKSGVCTKGRVWIDESMTQLAKRLCEQLTLPVGFCFQVMKNAGAWVITDLNARLGAGTSLSTAAGWSLAEAVLKTWAELPDPLQTIQDFAGERFAVRAFRDIRTK